MPRIQFRWDNEKREQNEKHTYETRDKIWSVKTDGTDLRLVTDDFDGFVSYIRRSPNNRYLTYAYSGKGGQHKSLFDLKTGKTKILGTYPGLPIFLWAEDSSYFYYANGRNYFKYDIASGEEEVVKIDMAQHSVIYGGRRIVVNNRGIGVYDEKTNKALYGIVPEPDVDGAESKFLKRSISPTGRYVYVKTRSKKMMIDTQTKQIKTLPLDSKRYTIADMLGLGARYGTAGAAGRYTRKYDENGNSSELIKWVAIGTGFMATKSSLYNGFTNDGAFLKEED